MKHIIAALTLLFASLSWAQTPVNIDSASAQEQGLQSRINSADTAAAAEQQPATPAAAPAPQVAAPDAGGSNGLILGALALLSVAAIAVAIAALAKANAAKKKESLHEFSALKEALKQRTDELDQHLRRLEERIAAAEQKMTTAQKVTAAPPRRATVAAPRLPKPAEQKPAAATKLYLSRADERGTFLAASARFEPGNSIFLLTVGADGASGTFEVIADAGVHQLALMMPTESLTRACTGTDIQISAGKRRIVTDAPGTANKRGGEWCVASPAVIHYE